jgi:hypothetical protein
MSSRGCPLADLNVVRRAPESSAVAVLEEVVSVYRTVVGTSICCCIIASRCLFMPEYYCTQVPSCIMSAQPIVSSEDH